MITKMKQYQNTIKEAVYALILLLAFSCQKINDALDVEDIKYLSVNLEANPVSEGITSTAGLRVVLENFTEGFRFERLLEDGITKIDSIVPGRYSINISGNVQSGNETYYLNGSKINYLILEDKDHIQIDVDGATVGPFAFSEIFYSGTDPFYFRNQFYEITNNSDQTVYADGLYFARLIPIAATTTMPIWPDEDGNQYVYTDRIWRIPGNGTQYPLRPGESFTIAQFAANHKLPQYNPNSPIDCSTSEFEFNMDNPNFPDQPAADMEHIFLNGRAAKGSVPQYLTSVFGSALVIFRVPEGEAYDPVENTELQTRNLGTTAATLYAKIPRKYVVDAVESVQNETMVAAKRMPSVLDAGITYVDATYNSLGVRRKKTGERTDGSPILTDTNNSTEDFERKVIPTFRYHGQGIPAWSSAR